MALITCPECQNQISDSAASCPKCGYVLTPEKISTIKKKAELKIKKTCPKCGSLRPRGLLKCPRCGVKYADAEKRRPVHPAPVGPPSDGDQKKGGCLGVFLMIAVAVFMLSICSKSEDSSKIGKKWKEENNSTMAYIMMEDFVKKRLKAPGSADFPSWYEASDHVEYLGGQTYRIKSYVDAQNAFGAKIRNNFIGKIKQTSEDYWELLSLEFAYQ